MTILVIAGVLAALWLFSKVSSPTGGSTSDKVPPPNRSSDSETYRPKRQSGRTNSVKFKDTSPTRGAHVADLDLKDLRDAFTGAPLNANLGLYRCTSCKVYYHTESFEIVRTENAGRCVACSASSIVAVTAGATAGRNFDPDVVTLENFRQHFGRVVTFEGDVKMVRTSRAGTDFAVMFEQKSWVSGFKLVFFRQAVRRVGGAAFIEGLANRRVRVRGLLINHHQFGPEIIISERSMILSIK